MSLRFKVEASRELSLSLGLDLDLDLPSFLAL